MAANFPVWYKPNCKCTPCTGVRLIFEELKMNVSPTAPIVENEKGGKQSLLEARYDLIDGKATTHLAEILAYGAKRYASNNWRKISTEDHINHALMHLFHYLAEDTQDDHLGHAYCRLMMALATKLSETDGTK